MPNPNPLKRKSASCTFQNQEHWDVTFAFIRSVKGLALHGEGQRWQGIAILKTLGATKMSKSKRTSVWEVLSLSRFYVKVLEVLPGGDPSWGVLRQACTEFLEAMAAHQGDEGYHLAKAWDARLLADQFATSLFLMRKLLRSPGKVAEAMTRKN